MNLPATQSVLAYTFADLTVGSHTAAIMNRNLLVYLDNGWTSHRVTIFYPPDSDTPEFGIPTSVPEPTTPPPRRRPWTKPEVDRLVKLRRRGLSYAECAERLPDRNANACYLRIRKIRAPDPSLGQGGRWTPEEEERLLAMVDAGKSLEECGAAMRRTPRAVMERHKKLRKVAGPLLRWTDEDSDKLVAMLEEDGNTMDECALALGRTTVACQSRFYKIRPGNKAWVPWTDDDIATLLRLQKEGNSFSEIAKQMDRSYNACLSRYRRMDKEG